MQVNKIFRIMIRFVQFSVIMINDVKKDAVSINEYRPNSSKTKLT